MVNGLLIGVSSGPKTQNRRSSSDDPKQEQDGLQTAMGSFGPWQIIICLVVSLVKVPIAWHQLAILFLAPPQDFWCSSDASLSKYPLITEIILLFSHRVEAL